MSDNSLLAVFAHPDDETFRCGGTLALPARRGVHVQVLTATRGQAGSCGDPPLCPSEELPAVRERELRCACAFTLEQLTLLKSRPDEGREARLLDLGTGQVFGSAFLSRALLPGAGALTPNRRNKS